MTAAIARHHQRVVSLRVHRAARQDGRASVTKTAVPARETEPMTVAAREAGNSYSPQRRLLGWLAAVYAAHETRLITLRVYDHSRV